jgi:hypothetical protein
MTDKELKELRKAKHRARDRRRRRAAGSKPHAASLARLKPWESEDISRRSWFRKQAKHRDTNSCAEQECRGTNSCAINLSNSRALISATEKPERLKEASHGGEAEESRESVESAESVEKGEKRARASGS